MFFRSFLFCSAMTLACMGVGVSLQQSPAPKAVDFNRDVRPILAQHCLVCHGQDQAALKKTGGIRLDSFKGATAVYFGTRPIVPGDPAKSELLARVGSSDPSMLMPPPESGIKRLSSDEIATFRSWIAKGAEYSVHWAFVPPKTPALPRVEDAKWIRNDIDPFILAGLEKAGLKPEPEADKATLIRRVTLTLTGLPPTPEEVDRFVSDTRADAYERLVDRLLANPRFGENEARYWLDAVRYADTHGLHIDNERSIFPYRDWVVRAYNQDLPYNQFVLWQLAGDLLPHPTLDQKIATGYVRLNPTSNEGGAIEAEFLAKNTFDRVDTTSTVFLGLTLQCSKCHDHKYDPFTMRDYYSMYALFNSTADTPLDGNLKLHEPVMPAPTPEQSEQLGRLDKAIGDIGMGTQIGDARLWAKHLQAGLPTVKGWETSGPYAGKDFDDAYAQPFGPEPGSTAAGMAWRPVDFELEKPHGAIVGKENAAAYLRATVHFGSAVKVPVRLGSDDAIKVWLNGKAVFENKVMRSLAPDEDTVNLDFAAGDNQLLVKIVNASGEDGAFVGIGGPENQRLARAQALADLEAPKAEDLRELTGLYLQLGPKTDGAVRFRNLSAARDKLNSEIPMTYVAKELPTPRPAFILRRGQYDLPGDPVGRALPKVFGCTLDPKNQNRLGLAEWMIDPKNPLTARVMVNRIWQQHLGLGLVKSSEDFGSRGDWPTNPQLLDYLACRFVNDGWSIKKLTRLIVTSAAYRQAATASPFKRRVDPEDTLVSRGPRFRLDAEVIRDTALYVSGLLVENIGGHADKPYQPPGLWEIIAYPISDTAKYKQDHGDALYRRSLYLFWKRTSPPPTMLLLDAPMRESCVVRRSRTNTPTQALATLNETGFFEDARAMAQRLIKARSGDQARLDYAFELAVGRRPNRQEAQVVEEFLNDARAKYRSQPGDAEKTLSVGESPRDKALPVGEHAAWTLVCNMILNLDETITLH